MFRYIDACLEINIRGGCIGGLAGLTRKVGWIKIN